MVSSWCCHDKYVELKQSGYNPTGKADYLYYASQTNKKERKVKVLGMLSTFNYITNISKKRELNQPPSKFSLIIATKSNKQVNLTAHDTHQQAQLQAGIDINGPPLGASSGEYAPSLNRWHQAGPPWRDSNRSRECTDGMPHRSPER